jgi:hypothetical protein
LPYKKHGKKLPYDFFYEKNDDEDHDEFIYDERDDGNEESLRMGIKAKRVFKKFMRDAIEENIECTYTSFVESFKYKGMSRHTLAHLFVILGDDVDCSDPIESPGVLSVPSSGIVAKKVFKTPKRAIPINYECMANDELWLIWFGVVERHMLNKDNEVSMYQYKMGMGNAALHLNSRANRTLEGGIQCSMEEALAVLNTKEARWPAKFIKRMFRYFDRELESTASTKHVYTIGNKENANVPARVALEASLAEHDHDVGRRTSRQLATTRMWMCQQESPWRPLLLSTTMIQTPT